jgi:hypothetical protein
MLDGLSVVVEDMMKLFFYCIVLVKDVDCNVFLEVMLYVQSGR